MSPRQIPALKENSSWRHLYVQYWIRLLGRFLLIFSLTHRLIVIKKTPILSIAFSTTDFRKLVNLWPPSTDASNQEVTANGPQKKEGHVSNSLRTEQTTNNGYARE